MLGLFIRSIRIFGPIEKLIVSAGMIGAAIADIGRLFEFRTKIREEIRAMLCAVTGFAAFAKIIAKFAITYTAAIAGGKQSTIIFQMIMTAVFRPSMFSNLFRDSGRILFQNGSYIFEGIMIRQSLFDVDSVRESHMFLCMN